MKNKNKKASILPLLLTGAAFAIAILLSQALPLSTAPAARASTGGSLFPHIKTWGIYLSTDGTVQESTFAGHHLDMPMGRLDKAIIDSINPNALFCGYFHPPSGSPAQSNFVNWITSTGYDPEDFMLHYRDDFFSVAHNENKKGWQAGCSPSSCTPAATATSEAAARFEDLTKGNGWYYWNLEDSRFKEFVGYQQLNFNVFTQPFPKCFMLDELVYFSSTLNVLGFPKSDVYYGIPADNNHPFMTKTFTWGNELLDYFESEYGVSMIGIPNMSASSVINTEPFKTLVEQHYDWALIENWSVFTDSDTSINGVSPTSYENDYQNDIVKILQQTKAGEKRLVRGFEVYGHESNRGKIFGLANFYLINNENAYFNYNVFNGPGADDVPTKRWFSAIEYNIGQPRQNTPGQADYAGQQNTTEHYVWVTGADPANTSKTYTIFARNYDNAFVLVKYRPNGSTFGDASATTHNLPQPYYALQSDGTLGPEITQVTLRNNEAAILIPKDVTAPAVVSDLQAL